LILALAIPLALVLGTRVFVDAIPAGPAAAVAAALLPTAIRAANFVRRGFVRADIGDPVAFQVLRIKIYVPNLVRLIRRFGIEVRQPGFIPDAQILRQFRPAVPSVNSRQVVCFGVGRSFDSASLSSRVDGPCFYPRGIFRCRREREDWPAGPERHDDEEDSHSPGGAGVEHTNASGQCCCRAMCASIYIGTKPGCQVNRRG